MKSAMGICLLLCWMGTAEAKSVSRAVSVRSHVDRDAVFVARTQMWRGSQAERVKAAPVWSKDRGAVAFVTKDRRAQLSLVVVLVGGPADGHVMRWPVRASAATAVPIVTWLSSQRVVVAAETLRPTIVASWQMQ